MLKYVNIYRGIMLTKTELKGGDRHTDIRTDIQTDQTDRLQEFHMVYGTKNVKYTVRRHRQELRRRT